MRIYIPDMIHYNTTTLQYGTNVGKVKEQGLILDKQVFCRDLILFLTKEKIQSFDLEIEKNIEKSYCTDNPYRPILKTNFKLSVSNTNYKKDINKDVRESLVDLISHISNCLIAFKNFDNYVSSQNQEEVFWWIYKKAKEEKVYALFSEELSKFRFCFNEDFASSLVKDAYGDNYPIFFSEILKEKLPNKENQKRKMKV